MSTRTERVRDLVNNLNLGMQKEKAGDLIVKDPGPAVPDSTETTSPTVAEFNALLASLRAAGVIAS
ncbi:hypothetical protein [Bordetella phage vB_BbrM_PHB04]|uniref:Head fiber protein n=1 Tax=Bordetella phage vB_BbrM_PHB04 TaxID=2029657 RepID=A0A291LAJ4_9CAUD|nr:hypothetical protein HOS14_gp018 [Bordetella phage vB_BbrM_PHB04]ATI15636.1 hypothetical protein [Bordetella phage vB_BbrM_PHB04]